MHYCSFELLCFYRNGHVKCNIQSTFIFCRLGYFMELLITLYETVFAFKSSFLNEKVANVCSNSCEIWLLDSGKGNGWFRICVRLELCFSCFMMIFHPNSTSPAIPLFGTSQKSTTGNVLFAQIAYSTERNTTNDLTRQGSTTCHIQMPARYSTKTEPIWGYQSYEYSMSASPPYLYSCNSNIFVHLVFVLVRIRAKAYAQGTAHARRCAKWSDSIQSGMIASSRASLLSDVYFCFLPYIPRSLSLGRPFVFYLIPPFAYSSPENRERDKEKTRVESEWRNKFSCCNWLALQR